MALLEAMANGFLSSHLLLGASWRSYQTERMGFVPQADPTGLVEAMPLQVAANSE
jgi:hypothetical protein